MSDFFITLDIYNESGHQELIKISSHGNKRHATSEPPCQPLKRAHLFKMSGYFQKRERKEKGRTKEREGNKEGRIEGKKRRREGKEGKEQGRYLTH